MKRQEILRPDVSSRRSKSRRVISTICSGRPASGHHFAIAIECRNGSAKADLTLVSGLNVQIYAYLVCRYVDVDFDNQSVLTHANARNHIIYENNCRLHLGSNIRYLRIRDGVWGGRPGPCRAGCAVATR